MKISFVAALSAALAAWSPCVPSWAQPAQVAGANQAVSFKTDVLPIFQVHCLACHTAPDGDGFKASGLNLATYQGVMAGTKYGPMVVPGDPDNSNLMWLLDWRASPQLRMPHGQKQLPADERSTLRTWIRQGAKNN